MNDSCRTGNMTTTNKGYDEYRIEQDAEIKDLLELVPEDNKLRLEKLFMAFWFNGHQRGIDRTLASYKQIMEGGSHDQ